MLEFGAKWGDRNRKRDACLVTKHENRSVKQKYPKEEAQSLSWALVGLMSKVKYSPSVL